MWSHKNLTDLAGLCGKTNYFAVDRTDEFGVSRLNGETQGIFKTYASPIIPFLDSENLALFRSLWQNLRVHTGRNVPFWDAARLISAADPTDTRIPEMEVTLHLWQKTIRDTPTKLKESLDRVTTNCWLLDQRLAEAFTAEGLPTELPKRISVLVHRLILAFGMAAPFYSLEALVGDARWLGAGQSCAPLSGRLDVVAFLLPSAFRSFVRASAGNWNGLNWRILRSQVKELARQHSDHRTVLMNIARILEVEPHWVLFAANVLEFIPRRVGGKKKDLRETEALGRLVNLVKGEVRIKSSLDVLKEVNALIRFRNWLPLIESESNFAGLNWTYAAVCDTTNHLMETISQHPEVLAEKSAEEFRTVIIPQLQVLDATSAKGRFLLEFILNEQGLKGEFTPTVSPRWQARMMRRIVFRPRKPLADAHCRVYPKGIVGGKPHGVALASHILGRQKVLGGFVLTTEHIEQVLRGNPAVWKTIRQLEQDSKLHDKEQTAEKIRELIPRISIPRWFGNFVASEVGMYRAKRWAVRTSSLVEGEARGVHKTVLDVPANRCLGAVLQCITSFYSREAICFRFSQRMSDVPLLAVFLQPYVNNSGGVAEKRLDDESPFLITSGATAARVTSGNEVLTEWIGRYWHQAPRRLKSVAKDVDTLADIFGATQIEWVHNGTAASNTLVLQMEILPSTDRNGFAFSESPTRLIKFSGPEKLTALKNTLTDTADTIGLVLGPEVNPNEFQSAIMAVIARHPNRVTEVRSSRFISHSSHLANILRFYGVRLLSEVE